MGKRKRKGEGPDVKDAVPNLNLMQIAPKLESIGSQAANLKDFESFNPKEGDQASVPNIQALSNQFVMRIPTYQRPYSWDEQQVRPTALRAPGVLASRMYHMYMYV